MHGIVISAILNLEGVLVSELTHCLISDIVLLDVLILVPMICYVKIFTKLCFRKFVESP